MSRITLAYAPLLLALAGCVTGNGPRLETAAPAPAQSAVATRVLDRAAADQLLHNAGVTLQWIDWNTRGTANARDEAGTIRLTASQASATGPGRLWLDGRVTEVGADYFVFSGTIRITDTPDAGRKCEATRDDWRFAVTQNRPYWRLRTFEWCDGLTDYIDIYKPMAGR
ncbi:hypothetical protein [Novosphingobium jiangmenense]|uniref:Lipoprotein n=1 Tax=Novosphingobium jiangmenense TaxID=2791981 RepID=A0ABS0HGZ2_9SPHN|nr:hypothetical protein [Novosphingobium jiangmenense]MBF9151295.1 hypothetical protein [Novosphingobium jiangmenense]